MLKISERDLKLEAKEKGYRSEMLEKVYRLLDLLSEFMAVPYLSERLALKGGTAINLFCTDSFPRLSVDLDFNYIGATNLPMMQKEKPEVEKIIVDICKRNKYDLHRNPRAHAGGKMVLIYQSLTAPTKGRLEVDLNYVFRVPLWDATWRSSPTWPAKTNARVLDIHELAAGKLHALLGREASRDLFDSHQLLTKWPLDATKMRFAFTVYAAMERRKWQNITVNDVNFSVKDIRDKLIPVLKNSEAPSHSFPIVDAWAKKLVDECKARLSLVLPFQEQEMEFLNRIEQDGDIRPDLITNNGELCSRIVEHPLLKWRINQNTN